MTEKPPTFVAEFHHSGLNAAWIIAAYVVLRPFFLSASGPRTLSVGETSCCASGFRPSIFRPRSGNVRPSHDISTLLFGGPTACDARLAFGMRTMTGTGPDVVTWRTVAFGSFGPKGLAPLKTLFARPSQKLRKLKIAFTADGAFRPVT